MNPFLAFRLVVIVATGCFVGWQVYAIYEHLTTVLLKI